MNPLRWLANVSRPWRKRHGLLWHRIPLLLTDLTEAELDVLLSTFRDAATSIYVEIGVFWGGSMKRILEVRKRHKMTTQCIGIDLWDELQDPAANTHVSGWPNRERVARALRKRRLDGFTFHAGTAADLSKFVPGPADVVFHDANHTYQAICDDMEQIRTVMAPGGYLLVHNASQHMKPDHLYVAADGGPHRAVHEQAQSGKWELVEIRDRMAVLRLPR